MSVRRYQHNTPQIRIDGESGFDSILEVIKREQSPEPPMDPRVERAPGEFTMPDSGFSKILNANRDRRGG